MRNRLPSRQQILDTAHKLRTQLPRRAPMWLAERTQHCVVRLELIAEQTPIPDEAAMLMALAETLLQTFASMLPGA